jgi:hypothetical protein
MLMTFAAGEYDSSFVLHLFLAEHNGILQVGQLNVIFIRNWVIDKFLLCKGIEKVLAPGMNWNSLVPDPFDLTLPPHTRRIP